MPTPIAKSARAAWSRGSAAVRDAGAEAAARQDSPGIGRQYSSALPARCEPPPGVARPHRQGRNLPARTFLAALAWLVSGLQSAPARAQPASAPSAAEPPGSDAPLVPPPAS